MSEQQTIEKIERPSIDDAYADLTYNDDQAIEQAFGFVVDDLIERLYGGSADDEDPSQVDNQPAGLSSRDLLHLILGFELARLLRDGVPAKEAEAAVKAFTKRQQADLLAAYVEQDESGVDEGKGDVSGE